jgi:hypothetical protein
MFRQGKLRQRNAAAIGSALLFAEGHAVGALVNSGIHFVGTHQDLIQGAVVFVPTVVGTLLDGTLDALVCMTVHRKASFEFGFGNSMDGAGQSMQETFSKLAKVTVLCYSLS